MENIFCSKCGTSLTLPAGSKNAQFIKCCNCDNTFKNPNISSNQKILNDTKTSNTPRGMAIAIAVIGVVWIIGSFSGSTKSTSNQQNTQSESTTSYHVTQDTYAATSEENFDEMFKYFKVNDEEAIATFLNNGNMVILSKGTELYLLDYKYTYSIVREKDSTQELWVVPEHIKKTE